jgi:hypothetical protein
MWALVIIAFVALGASGANPQIAMTTLDNFDSEQHCQAAAATMSILGHGPGGSDHFVIARCVQRTAPPVSPGGPTGPAR